MNGKTNMTNLKLKPNDQSSARCWFCRSEKSVNYIGKIVNTNPMSTNRFMQIYVCEKCAEYHDGDFIRWEVWEK